MVTPEQLYAATDDGLDILALHYPRIREAARTKKPFKARPDERTPSASVKRYQSSQGFYVWKVTDFGDEGRATDPIAIHMRETGLRFPEAILDLAQMFNVTDEINRAVNRPDIRKQPATPEQEDGQTYWEIDQEFTDAECKIMGPRVTREHLKALHWYRVKVLISVRNREAVYKYPNENYPIFMRECWFNDKDGKPDRFYKIYEPLNADKQWRFQYQPKGKKPQSYVNGLYELADRWTEYNKQEEKLFRANPDNEDKSYKDQKLPEAVICSGERDAICVRSLGYHPIWFNSETYQVSDDEWRQINKYVDTVYNIPDIDTTGRLKGTQLALRFIDLHTIWLPSWLSNYKDNRGKPRKDFRDWMELRKEKNDFRGLLALATPAKFWYITKNEKTGKLKYGIDISCLCEFLMLQGFYTLKEEHSECALFVRIEGSIVRSVTAKDIRNFVHNWCIETAQPRELRNLVLTTTMLSSTILEGLKEINPDFSNYTEKTQIFYFPKFAIEVTGDGMVRHENKTSALGRYVWEENVIDHNIRILPDMFKITHREGRTESEDFDIEIMPNDSNYFRYLINSSRIYWRKELEQGLSEMDQDASQAYRKEHRFDIAGPLLDAAEIQEQKQCLINKIFTIGYMLHRYKSESRAWAPFVMDNVIGENDQCNGRSGKSFMFRALKHFTRWLKLSGRNPKLLDNQFAFEQIDRHTGIVVIDDCDEYFPFKRFYDNLTSDLTINAKNISAYTLPFDQAPKFAFTTNYVPKEFDGSSVGRMLFVVFSDYYHQRTEENDYNETRAIRSDFGKDLMGSTYTEQEWEADINFMLQCARFYLSVVDRDIKIEPQIGNIIFRKYLRDMSDNFREWAGGYFAIDENGRGDNLNRELVRERVFEDYKRYSGVMKITMQKFTKQLKGFCYTCDYIEELNPEDLHTSGDRILRRIEDPTGMKVQKEMIYIRTKQEAARLKNPPPPPPQPLFDFSNPTDAPDPF